MFDVTALGELLIDFTPGGASGQGNPLFEANPGGAPCNVLAMLARLGRRTTFVGKVGDDLFGRMLKGSIAETGIDAGALVLDPAAHTTLAFVQNAPDGDRTFSFYRDPGADELLTPEELPESALRSAGIFHFGSLSLTREPSRAATRRAVALAAEGGAVVSFDPNLRPSLWKSLDAAREEMLWGCSVCQVLKVAEEELSFLTTEEDLEAGAAKLRELDGRLTELRKERRRLLKNEDIEDVIDALHRTADTLHAGPEALDSFDESLFADLVEKIIAESQTRIRFRLYCGIELTAQLREVRR